MRAASPIVRFRNAVAMACRAVGVPDDGILVSANGIAIPEANVVISVALSDSGRVWRAVQRYMIRAVGEDDDREMTVVLFEEPLEREWAVAKRIAMRIAEGRIDAAIDANAG